MNRRQFIAGAMATVAACYAGGTYRFDETVDSPRLEWKEQWFDYNTYYGMEVKYTNGAGEEIRQGLRMRVSRLPNDHRDVNEEMKTKMKGILLNWLEATV